ncbi:MAG TPA: Pr6Pr family membrane protein [Jatrophihabitans sp.]|nr:Pr6Pr family membrane protein [Jatrophihabitans sp.]
MIARAWHAVIAVFVLVAVVTQVIIAIRLQSAPHDVSAGVVRGASLLGRLIRVVSFFTIQSNILAGVVSATLARTPDRDGPGWRVLRLAALFGITVTGVVYATVLAPIHEPHGAAEVLTNLIVHYIVPIMMVLGWLLFGPRPRITGQTVLRSLLFPVLWLVYTLIRGAIWKWYPYPFLDVPSHGYQRVLLNSVAVTAVFAVLASLFAVGDRRLGAAP